PSPRTRTVSRSLPPCPARCGGRDAFSPAGQPGNIARRIALSPAVDAELVWRVNHRPRIATAFQPGGYPFVLSVAGTLDGGTIPPELILPSSEIFALIGKTLFPSGCGRRILPLGRRRAARRWYGDTGGLNT
ncbi:MAG: hypothetical protein H0T49_00130, partial [Chloroflexia bacterium]|nr:hypothetical protein [Chloroflexia bacterium]